MNKKLEKAEELKKEISDMEIKSIVLKNELEAKIKTQEALEKKLKKDLNMIVKNHTYEEKTKHHWFIRFSEAFIWAVFFLGFALVILMLISAYVFPGNNDLFEIFVWLNNQIHK